MAISATCTPIPTFRNWCSVTSNRSYREEVLDAHLFESLDQEREITDAWLDTYNTERPHDSLGRVPPLMFLPRPDVPAESSFAVST